MKKLLESGKNGLNLEKICRNLEKYVGFWKISRNLEKKLLDSGKSGWNLGKMFGIWKKWPDFNGRRAGRVSRVLEEEIRHPTRRRRVFGVRTRVRPPEPSDRVIPGRVPTGGAGWAGGRFIWTTLLVKHLDILKN